MFDKYVQITKEQPFYISWLILIVISCVAFSYNFQWLLTWDDGSNMNGVNNAFPMMMGFFDAIRVEPRALGWFVSQILSDGTTAKNGLVFLSLVLTAWFGVFYIRQGFAMQSVFLTVTLAALIVLNSAMGMHYNFAVNVIRLIPAFYGLSLFVAVIVDSQKINIFIATILLFVCISVYQPIAQEYIVAVVALVIIEILKNNHLSIGENFKRQLKNKIIPAILVLLFAVLINFLLVKILLHNTQDQIEYGKAFQMAVNYDIASVLHHWHVIINQIIYQLYIGSLFVDYRIMIILLCSALIALIFYLRRQSFVKIAVLITVPIILIGFSSLIINIYNLMMNYDYAILRLSVPYGIIIALLFYLIYLAVQGLKKMYSVFAICAFIFTVQIINSTISRSFELLKSTQARHHMINRLLDDVTDFARANKVVGKIIVSFLYSTRQITSQITGKHKYLHDNNYTEVQYQYFHWLPQYFITLGGANYFRLYANKQKIIKNCKIIMNDKSMHRWPAYNSMKLIDGVIYVRLDNNKKNCQRVNDYNTPEIMLKDGRVILSTNSIMKMQK